MIQKKIRWIYKSEQKLQNLCIKALVLNYLKNFVKLYLPSYFLRPATLRDQIAKKNGVWFSVFFVISRNFVPQE